MQEIVSPTMLSESKNGHNYSNLNHQDQEPFCNSQQLPLHLHEQHQQVQWIANYINGEFYVSNKENMDKLKYLEEEIEKEKQKLSNIEHDAISNNSFLSQNYETDKPSYNKSICPTEFNFEQHQDQQFKMKSQLENQQEKYRENIRNLQKKRMELKKITQELEEPKLEIPVQEKSEIHKESSARKSQMIRVNPTEKSLKKSIVKSIKQEKEEALATEKQQSHRKSRIEKSIKQNSKINELLLHEMECNKQPSQHKSSKIHEDIEKMKFQEQKSNIIAAKSVKQQLAGESQKSLQSSLKKVGSQISQKKSYIVKVSVVDSLKHQNQESQKSKQISVSNRDKYEQKSKRQALELHEDHKSSKISEKQQIQNLKSVPFNEEIKIENSISAHHDEELKSKKSQIQSKRSEMQSKKSQVQSKKPSEMNKNEYDRNFIEAIPSSKSQKSDYKSQTINIQENKIYQGETFLEVKNFQKSVKASSKKASSKKASEHASIQLEKLEENKSKASQRKSQRKSIRVVQKPKSKRKSIKNESQKEISIRYNNASSLQEHQAVKSIPIVDPIKLVDKSIQWSELQSSNLMHVNEVKYHQLNQTDKSCSFLNQNQTIKSVNSQAKFDTLQQEIKEENAKHQPSPDFNMKKKKQHNQENQSHFVEPLQDQSKLQQDSHASVSQKKSKSFVIHSKQGSIRQKSQKKQKSRNSGMESEKSSQKASIKQQFSKIFDNQQESIPRSDINRLNSQIVQLQEKLRKVEEKQQQIEKLEATISKIQHNASNNEIEADQFIIQQEPIKQRPRLSIQNSIIQINTREEVGKHKKEQNQQEEKIKLQEEINRLKKIIRDIQIEKIKSIDPEDNVSVASHSKLQNKKNDEGKQNSIEGNQSLIFGLDANKTHKRPWNSTGIKSRLEDAGKIVKNSPEKDTNYIFNSTRLKAMRSDDYGHYNKDSHQELPVISPKKSSQIQKIYNQLKKSEIIEKIHQNNKDFHEFIESSRIIQEEPSKFSNFSSSEFGGYPHLSSTERKPQEQEQNFSPKIKNEKINYSRMVEEMKKHNPQDDEILPEIKFRDLNPPVIPQTPTAELSQDDLLNLAKQTYKIFGISVEEEEKQLCLKKYKNCVVFALGNSTSECILWHYSGKFYMGGWKGTENGEGQKTGEGLQYIPDKHTYKGQFLNGKKNGTGVIKMANGNIYDGQWINGVKNGRGVYLDAATRVLYSGEWRDGKKQGYGFLKLSQKEYYLGTFIKSVKEGYGKETFVNGDRYKGQYRNGKFHGKGKYTWANGSCYEGQFLEGVRHGQGSWKSSENNADIYIGSYESDKKNGYGRYVWSNGCIYEGGFSKDVKHGKGRLTYQDGKEIKGVWDEGNLMTTENEKNSKLREHEDEPLRKSMKMTAISHISKKF